MPRVNAGGFVVAANQPLKEGAVVKKAQFKSTIYVVNNFQTLPRYRLRDGEDRPLCGRADILSAREVRSLPDGTKVTIIKHQRPASTSIRDAGDHRAPQQPTPDSESRPQEAEVSCTHFVDYLPALPLQFRSEDRGLLQALDDELSKADYMV
ncbi:hypothetical protein [Endozoicomonas sp.]|uniref:hypothetical protein n=1 Tax=Endozoicomonas sp. TaxID=1892382 RepID=UPI00288711A9|nr:hypothetical protein [Endozoicomonas sp.]